MRTLALRLTLAWIGAIFPAAALWHAAMIFPSQSQTTWFAALFAAPSAALMAALGRREWLALAFGAALVAVSGHTAARARPLLEAARSLHDDRWPAYDLREAAIPDPPPRFITVKGYFRSASALEEYDPPDGEKPDQSKPALAVLVPFLGTRDAVVEQRGPVVIARVTPGRELAEDLQTLRGATAPLPNAVLSTLVRTTGTSRPGILLDTLDEPKSRDAWPLLAAAAICSLFGGLCFCAVARPISENVSA